MANRKRYTDKFRATAVVMLEAQGYPAEKGALTKVANHLKVPRSTLSGWFNAEHNPPPSELRHEKRGDLIALIEGEIDAALREMSNARPDASYRDLGTVLGILVDKKQLLTGQPTANDNQRIIIEYADDDRNAAGIATTAHGAGRNYTKRLEV